VEEATNRLEVLEGEEGGSWEALKGLVRAAASLAVPWEVDWAEVVTALALQVVPLVEATGAVLVVVAMEAATEEEEMGRPPSWSKPVGWSLRQRLHLVQRKGLP
jgi:hypothetical protein